MRSSKCYEKIGAHNVSTMTSISKYQRQQTLEEPVLIVNGRTGRNSKRNRAQFCFEDARKSTFSVLIRFKKRRSQFNRDKRRGRRRRRTVTRFPLTGRASFLFVKSSWTSRDDRQYTFLILSFQCQAMHQSGRILDPTIRIAQWFEHSSRLHVCTSLWSRAVKRWAVSLFTQE